MTLAINLPEETSRHLEREAAAVGLSPADLAAQIIRRELTARPATRDAITLLQSWIDQGNEAEQRETYEYLTRVLDEDRPGDRRLFPPELKGVTW